MKSLVFKFSESEKGVGFVCEHTGNFSFICSFSHLFIEEEHTPGKVYKTHALKHVA